VYQRVATKQVELSELTERAAGMLESASAAGGSRGITEAVTLFDGVMSVCSRGPHAEYWKSVVNLADALIKQAEADGSDGPIARALDLLDANERHFRTGDRQIRFLQRKGQALLLRAQRKVDKSVMRSCQGRAEALPVDASRPAGLRRGHARAGHNPKAG
jgi:hypothetical protein